MVVVIKFQFEKTALKIWTKYTVKGYFRSKPKN